MKYVRNNNIEAVELGNELGMLNTETSMYYILDSISRDVWNMLENEISMQDLIIKIIEQYDVSFEVCRKDVKYLIEDMLSKGLVKNLS